MLVYFGESLKTLGYTDFDFQGDIKSSKSTSRNATGLFTKTLLERVFEKHVNCMGLKRILGLL